MYRGKRWFLASMLLVLIIISILGVKQVQSQEKYPTKPIDVIVAFAPGGGADLSARVAATYLNKKWGVPVNVINKPGGSTLPANVELYSAPPNGYTVIYNDQSISALGLIMKDLPFKVLDRTFLGMVNVGIYFFVVPSSTPYKSLEDVIKEAKRDPENFTWASLGGVGGHDSTTRQFFKAIGVDVSKTKPVMSKGGSETAALVSGGHVKLGAGSIAAWRGAVKAGLIRMLATTGKERHPEFPDVPTTAELGYPAMNIVWWAGFSGPPNMSSGIIDIWEKALQEMVKDPAYVSQATKMGNMVFYLNSRQLKEHVRKEIEELNELYSVK